MYKQQSSHERTQKHVLTQVSVFTVTALLGLGAARADGDPVAAVRADMQKSVGFVPEFVKAIPAPLLPGYWAEVKNFESNPKTALSNRDKGLIGLAVAAQAGSRSTIYSYTRCARASGAGDAEVSEAVAIAGLARRFSTFMNGVQLDEGKFRAEIAQLVANLKAGPGKPPAPIDVVDDASALAEIKQGFGLVPEFFKRMPPNAQMTAWLQMRDLEMNPKTALPGKTKSLISLAVAAQIPCRYCIIADTEFAKLEGATDREITEAVTMAGIARNFGTLIDGLQVDEVTFRRDFDRITGLEKSPRVARRAK
jgi:AhpD family alkylhydroperoxidase